MASTIKVDKIEGSTGSTITVPTGQTLTVTDGLAVASLPTVTVAKGGTNLTSFTAGDVLYATGSTTLAKLPKGTANQTLQMNAGATAPNWTTVAAASTDFVKIATVNGTGSSGVLDFQNCFSATYEKYLILAWLQQDTNNQIYIQFGNQANNATFRTSDYYSGGAAWYYSSGTSGGGSTTQWGTSEIKQNEVNNGHNSKGAVHHTLVVNPFDAALETTWQMHWVCEDSHKRFANFAGSNNSLESHSGFKYYIPSGSFKTMSKVTVYGIKED